MRVRLLADDDGSARAALGVVSRILEELDVDAVPTIRSSGSDDDQLAVIDIQGDDAGLLIGRRGETLRALQFITNAILNQGETRTGGVIVDVEQYRERRQRQLLDLAERMAQRAINNGADVTLDPMTAADRRIIHMSLADYKGVRTESSGEGSQRCVTISPTGEVRSSSGGGDRSRRRGRRPPIDR